jgi:osmoprotectant transport system ATP-binding protein
MIALEGAAARYGDAVALQPTTLAVPEGRTTALLGPSGCGKSTLLKLVIGLVSPAAGRVEVLGEDLTAASAPALRHRMGYVIQEGGLFPHLTAGANAALMARHLGWDAARVAARIAELADLTHLAPELLERYPRELSGGQRQRVALMRALFLDPEVLLLDEPLAALDPMIRAELQRDLKEIFARLGKTVLLVTHDVGEAGFLADEIVLMRAGTIVQRGSLEDLVRRPAESFTTEFVEAQRSPLEGLR